MTNDLKNFLEREYKSFGTDYGEPIGFKEGAKFCCGGDYCDGNHLEDMQDLKNHDTRLINFVLDLVENEIDNKRALDSEIFAASGNNDEESRDRIKVLEDISTIINQLRV